MLTGKNLSYEVSTHPVFRDVDVSILKGDKVGLVGPNGAGKTSLLNILAGKLEPNSGVVVNNGLEVGVLPQDLRDWFDNSVYSFLESVTGVKDARSDFEHAAKLLEKDANNTQTLRIYCEAVDRLNTLDADSFDSRVAKALQSVGLDESVADRYIGELSGGQRTRVALSAVLESKHDVILLDEPTNNLDLDGIVILEKFIQDSNAAFLMVSHDRRFLRNATTRIIELLGGDNGINQYGLGYDVYKEARENAYRAEVKAYEEHQQAVKQMKSTIREARVRANSADRSTKKSDSDKLTANYRSARAAGHLASQAKSQESRLEKLKEAEPNKPQAPVVLDFMFDGAEVVKKSYLSATNLVVRYDDGTELGPYNLRLSGADRIAIVGENGSGKSTLIKAIMGRVRVASGEIKISNDARFGYMDQSQTLPLPQAGLVENVMTMATTTTKKDAIHLLKKFNFTNDQVLGAKASNLSGGERAKVILAAIAANKSNVLILDEPTNNLDIPTIDGLQDAIASFPGAIIVVSHDREFVEGIGINQTIVI